MGEGGRGREVRVVGDKSQLGKRNRLVRSVAQHNGYSYKNTLHTSELLSV